jgi:hypothetical protein
MTDFVVTNVHCSIPLRESCARGAQAFEEIFVRERHSWQLSV